jgi:hypothetical protein
MLTEISQYEPQIKADLADLQVAGQLLVEGSVAVRPERVSRHSGDAVYLQTTKIGRLAGSPVLDLHAQIMCIMCV